MVPAHRATVRVMPTTRMVNSRPATGCSVRMGSGDASTMLYPRRPRRQSLPLAPRVFTGANWASAGSAGRRAQGGESSLVAGAEVAILRPRFRPGPRCRGGREFMVPGLGDDARTQPGERADGGDLLPAGRRPGAGPG